MAAGRHACLGGRPAWSQSPGRAGSATFRVFASPDGGVPDEVPSDALEAVLATAQAPESDLTGYVWVQLDEACDAGAVGVVVMGRPDPRVQTVQVIRLPGWRGFHPAAAAVWLPQMQRGVHPCADGEPAVSPSLDP